MAESSKITAFKKWVEEKISLKSMSQLSNLPQFIYDQADKNEVAEYHEETSRYHFVLKAVGTKYEGRPARIQQARSGDAAKISRDPNNKFDSNCLEILNSNSASLGNLPSEFSAVLSPLLDAKDAEILNVKIAAPAPSVPTDNRKSPILYVSFDVKVKEKATVPASCIICAIGGDQSRIWVQHIRVLYCSLPFENAKLLFEFYNRTANEYNQTPEDDCSYTGLDGLATEVRVARAKRLKEIGFASDPSLTDADEILKKEPDRYQKVAKLIDKMMSEGMENVFESFVTREQNYYWIDETHVSDADWDSISDSGFNHWYDVLELFEGSSLPVNLNDEDVVSVFGTNRFADLADLSYGC